MDANTQGTVRRYRRKFRPRNTALPTITGTAIVGQILTCLPGTWTNPTTTPPSSLSYKYQWVSQDGSSLASASSTNTYTVAEGDLGKKIQCIVIASNSAYPGAPARTARTAAVTIT
jgi:hypothetical protein